MYQLFLLTGKFDSLFQGAKSGFPRAQYRLAGIYEDGYGTFLPGNRKKEIDKWYKSSTEGGYAPGMSSYADFLKKHGDLKGAGHWTEKAAEAGHFGSMSDYAAWTAHMPDKVG